jgi:hypothetical protein
MRTSFVILLLTFLAALTSFADAYLSQRRKGALARLALNIWHYLDYWKEQADLLRKKDATTITEREIGFYVLVGLLFAFLFVFLYLAGASTDTRTRLAHDILWPTIGLTFMTTLSPFPRLLLLKTHFQYYVATRVILVWFIVLFAIEIMVTYYFASQIPLPLWEVHEMLFLANSFSWMTIYGSWLAATIILVCVYTGMGTLYLVEFLIRSICFAPKGVLAAIGAVAVLIGAILNFLTY